MSARALCCWCCLFQFHNDIIDICILMNIFPFIYIIFCQPLSSPSLRRHCFSIRLYFWAHLQFSVISANNIQFEFSITWKWTFTLDIGCAHLWTEYIHWKNNINTKPSTMPILLNCNLQRFMCRTSVDISTRKKSIEIKMH